jgi:hypothetical protein
VLVTSKVKYRGLLKISLRNIAVGLEWKKYEQRTVT